MLTESGEHAFSAGFNLEEIPFADSEPGEIRSRFETLAMWWHQVLHEILHLPRPVLAADLAVAVDSATFLVRLGTL